VRPQGVLVRPEAELRRGSNGREPWVFRASNAAELPLSAAAWPVLYGRQRKRHHEGRTCVAPAGAVIGTAHGLFFIGDDPTVPAGCPNSGVNAVCVVVDAVQAATLVDRTTSGPFTVALRLQLGRSETSMGLEVVFPGAVLDSIRTALGTLGVAPTMSEEIWSS
jgi:hypothetical protein